EHAAVMAGEGAEYRGVGIGFDPYRCERMGMIDHAGPFGPRRCTGQPHAGANTPHVIRAETGRLQRLARRIQHAVPDFGYAQASTGAVGRALAQWAAVGVVQPYTAGGATAVDTQIQNVRHYQSTRATAGMKWLKSSSSGRTMRPCSAE